MSNWSPILYGRTYEVDFRMLAIPKYFENEDRKWAEKYILPAMQNQNYILENQPRWVLIVNDKYCVFASACMVEELFSEEQLEKEKEYTLDKSKSRRLYAFIGYVAEKDENGQFPALPKSEEFNLELFRDTYLELVRDIWYCRNSQPKARKPIRTDAKVSVNFEDYSSQVNREIAEEFNLNFNPNSRLVCPEKEQEILWDLSIEDVTKTSNQNLSVCIGLVSQKEAIKSPFLNSTCSNIKRRAILPVENKTRKTPSQQSRNSSLLPISETNYNTREANNFRERETSLVSFEEVVGGVVGGIVGGVVGRFLPLPSVIGIVGVPGIVLGAGIGFMVAGALSNKGIGGGVANQARDYLGNSQDSYPDYPDIYRDRENRVSSNSTSNDAEINRKNIGLEKVDKKDSEQTKDRDADWF
ncbi:MAG: hypothetical protein AAF316_05665 [Cyanobacteria bacterium P01_A01_bin.80]